MNIRDFLTRHESRRNTVYRDPVGILTVGVGHVVTPDQNLRVGDIISEQEIDHLLSLDIEAAKRGVMRYVLAPAGMTNGQVDALISFVFNLGSQRFKTSTLCSLINQDRLDECGKEFDKWVYGTIRGKKVVLPGLVKRRHEERLLWEGKEIPEDA